MSTGVRSQFYLVLAIGPTGPDRSKFFRSGPVRSINEDRSGPVQKYIRPVWTGPKIYWTGPVKKQILFYRFFSFSKFEYFGFELMI
jgi:hypothetical protein